MRRWTTIAPLALVALSIMIAACGGGGRSTPPSGLPAPGSEPPPPAPTPDPAACEGRELSGTFEAIQGIVFDRHGCTQQVCHGAAASGSLDLRPDVAHANLFEVPSAGSRWARVEPGDKDRSYLWLKLAAKTLPDAGIVVAGSPMPSGLPAIDVDELELLRLWIYAGAPETGTVAGSAELIDGCLPELEPITIEPLEPPASDEGVQFVLPPVHLAAASEQELCFASYYDVSEQIPPEFEDPTGRYFRVRGQELRQDPQSHHLVLLYPDIPTDDLDHPAFGEWTCAGGERAGAACDPLDREACGAGFCRSRPVSSVGCVGYGPPGGGLAIFRQIGGAQEAQAINMFREGVFAQVPESGVVYWSTHSFNLTTHDHVLNGRLNFYFQSNQELPLQTIFDVSHVFAPSAAPFTTQTLCADHVMPKGARLFGLTSHTHERGKRFWAATPDGEMIYENFLYNDPVKQTFDPPLAFDSDAAADRTLHYCALYNNGMAEDGSPDPEAVARASRVPPYASFGVCEPEACAAGKVGAPCGGSGDDATCDSTPGAGDGWCDACPIVGGETTENEMFILIGQYYIDPSYPQPAANGPIFSGLASVLPAR